MLSITESITCGLLYMYMDSCRITYKHCKVLNLHFTRKKRVIRELGRLFWETTCGEELKLAALDLESKFRT